MTFNLRRDVASDGENAWPRRVEAVARVIRRARPHILGTQEGLAHQLEALDGHLRDYARVGGCRRGDGTDEHVALYYDEKRFELQAAGDLWLSATPERPGSATWGNRLPRSATWARLCERRTGSLLTVVNTHFDHESEHAREASARMLAERFPGALLLGDFNAEPGSTPHNTLTSRGWQDANLRKGRDESGTFHAFGREPRGPRFDWILAPVGARVLACRTLRARPRGQHPSDHHAVIAELVVPVPTAARPLAETTG